MYQNSSNFISPLFFYISVHSFSKFSFIISIFTCLLTCQYVSIYLPIYLSTLLVFICLFLHQYVNQYLPMYIFILPFVSLPYLGVKVCLIGGVNLIKVLHGKSLAQGKPVAFLFLLITDLIFKNNFCNDYN